MLNNKKGVIFGVANDHSIAWGIAKKLSENGAELALTYQNETFLKRIQPLASSINCNKLISHPTGLQNFFLYHFKQQNYVGWTSLKKLCT